MKPKLHNWGLPPDAVITGWWDGEPIWRHKEAHERFDLKEERKLV